MSKYTVKNIAARAIVAVVAIFITYLYAIYISKNWSIPLIAAIGCILGCCVVTVAAVVIIVFVVDNWEVDE